MASFEVSSVVALSPASSLGGVDASSDSLGASVSVVSVFYSDGRMQKWRIVRYIVEGEKRSSE